MLDAYEPVVNSSCDSRCSGTRNWEISDIKRLAIRITNNPATFHELLPNSTGMRQRFTSGSRFTKSHAKRES
jgi:hypothetical protein